MSKSSISVLKYIDYRLYLREYYADKKKHQRGFSFRWFNQKAGFTSPVYFKLVMEGKRNLTKSSIAKFCIALKFTQTEARYFKHLVLFNQATDAEEKQDNYQILISMAHHVARHELGSEQYKYLEKWYNPVVRELLTLHNFEDDFEVLANTLNPRITHRQAKKSVELLTEIGLVKKQTDGTYKPAERALTSNREVAGAIIRKFNKGMVEKALAAIDKMPHTKRHVSGITMSISRACREVLNTEIEAFKERVATIVDNDMGSDGVYQLNLQLFPLSEHLGEDDAEGEG